MRLLDPNGACVKLSCNPELDLTATGGGADEAAFVEGSEELSDASDFTPSGVVPTVRADWTESPAMTGALVAALMVPATGDARSEHHHDGHDVAVYGAHRGGWNT